jgi:hypothetical protein
LLSSVVRCISLSRLYHRSSFALTHSFLNENNSPHSGCQQGLYRFLPPPFLSFVLIPFPCCCVCRFRFSPLHFGRLWTISSR